MFDCSPAEVNGQEASFINRVRRVMKSVLLVSHFRHTKLSESYEGSSASKNYWKRSREISPQGEAASAGFISCYLILGVIHVHATSVAAGGQAMNSPYYVFINWVNIFFKFGTPCFIFLSSFVLFYNYMNHPAGRQLVSKFYKRRLLYIIIPYLVASCCYYALNTYLYGDWERWE